MRVGGSIMQFAAGGTALLLAGCAGGMTRAQCEGADWEALGFADGAAGARPKMFEERAKDCAGAGSGADALAYETGRARGLGSYCSRQGGFAAGRAGREYEGVCAADAAPVFLEAFELGARLGELARNKEKAVSDYESAMTALDQHRYFLRVAERRYAKASISNEDREKERLEAEYRRREIARLEGNMPKFLDEIDAARKALDAYRTELAAMGLAE